MSENLIKLEDAIKDNTLVKVEKYIPFIVMQNIVGSVIDACVSTDENGFKRVDPCIKRLSIDYSICRQQTNIDFLELEVIDAFDKLKSSGLLEYIQKEMSYDLWRIEQFVNETIDEIMAVENSVQGVLNRGIEKLLQKLPTDKQLKSLSKTLVKDLKNLDFDKLPFVAKAINYNNGVK